MPDYQSQTFLKHEQNKFDNTGKGLGGIEFARRPDKFPIPIDRPYFKPDYRTREQILNGEETLGIKKSVKGKVEISKQTNREDNMIFNYKKEDIRELKLKEQQKNFNFNNYIPNSLQNKTRNH